MASLPRTQSILDLQPGCVGHSPATIASPQDSDLYYLWTPRNHRKGRHTLVVSPATADVHEVPGYSNSPREIGKVLWRMATYYPVWDISWLIAYIYTIGCAAWVANAIMIILPAYHKAPKTLGILNGGAVAFAAAVIYEVGSILLLFEVFNVHQDDCFGWGVERLEDDIMRLIPFCDHHHADKHKLDRPESGWIWWPSKQVYAERLKGSIAYRAAILQLAASTIYCFTGLLGLPGIVEQVDSLSRGYFNAKLWLYVLPQIIGALLYVSASAKYMLETMTGPAFYFLRVLGWHISFWSLLGSFAFVCGPVVQGVTMMRWIQYPSLRDEIPAVMSAVGSIAFMIGSILQWYESLSKHPVERPHKYA